MDNADLAAGNPRILPQVSSSRVGHLVANYISGPGR
jgi:hypothetical protein